MSNFWNWLETRVAEYEIARERGLKAYNTRLKKAIAEKNDGVEPIESNIGFHAPFDGYVYEWTEGGDYFERTFLGGQFLPSDKESLSFACGGFTGELSFVALLDRAKDFEKTFNSIETLKKSPVSISLSRPFESFYGINQGKTVCYVKISKCPEDIQTAIEDKIMGDIYALQRLAEKQSEDQKAMRDQAHEFGEDAPEGRITITGIILAFKWQYSQYGDTLKMLVQDDRGFRVWGSVPASLDDAERESRVTFTATVQASDRDTKFGFFKRPAKAEIISEVEAA